MCSKPCWKQLICLVKVFTYSLIIDVWMTLYINTCIKIHSNTEPAKYRGTYKVRNEINENETKSTKTKRNEINGRFLCEFPIGSYVKLSSAVGAILVEGPNRPTYFWKRTIQWLFKNLLLWNCWANLNQTFLKWSLGGPLPKLCLAFQISDQDGHHSRT
jgi:hypothetical protein